MPDICVAEVRGRYSGLWLELKQPGNRPSPEQVELMEMLQQRRYASVWCDSLEDALDAIEKYLSGIL